MLKMGLAILSGLVLSAACAAQGQPDPVVQVYKTDGEYAFVVDDLKSAVLGRGMVISGTLHVSEMLERTAADLGFEGQPYVQAESIEFCSAPLSQRMTRADPRNLVICPFTVAVYVLADEPDAVYVAFRRPVLVGDAQEVEQAVFEMLDGIAREVVE